MKTIVILVLYSMSSISLAQYNLQWYSIYNNPHPSYYDEAIDIVHDNSGNVYVTGTSYQLGITDDWRYDFATIKYNPSGDSVWVRRYDSSIGDENFDGAVAIGIDGLDNIYVAGDSYLPTGVAPTIVKYDSFGNEMWVTNYHDSSLSIQRYQAKDMHVDIVGNIYLACYYYGNPAKIIKYNTNGQVVWVFNFHEGFNETNYLTSINIDYLGNISATGGCLDSGSVDWDYLTVKCDPNGILKWFARANQTNRDIAISVETDQSGNTYIAGYSKINTTAYDMKLIKYDSSGNQMWIQSYNGGYENDQFYFYMKRRMIALDANGNIYVNFISNRNSYYNDNVTAKFNSSGEMKWINIYNSSNGQHQSQEEPADMEIDNSNNIYVTGSSGFGSTSNTFVILKYDTTGFLKEILRNENQFPYHFIPKAITIGINGDITATGNGELSSNSNRTDYFTVKYSETSGIKFISNSISNSFTLSQNYPNPFNPTTKIRFDILRDVRREMQDVKLIICNILGKEVQTLVKEKLSQGSYEVEFDGSNFASGVYFYELQTNSFSETKKMLLLK